MTKQYIIELTDAEDKALSVVAFSQQDWIEHAVKERCRVAMEEIVQSEVNRKLSIGESITGTREDIVLEAVVETAAERHVRLEEEYKKFQEQQG